MSTNGGLIELTSKGHQDVYLTQNPEMSYWKAVYKQHTNFSIEPIKQTFVGQVRPGNDIITTISRNGDLMSRCYLVLQTNSYSYKISDVLESVELIIGSHIVDKHTGEFLDVWNELTMPKSKVKGFKDMTTHQAPKIYILNYDSVDYRFAHIKSKDVLNVNSRHFYVSDMTHNTELVSQNSNSIWLYELENNVMFTNSFQLLDGNSSYKKEGQIYTQPLNFEIITNDANSTYMTLTINNNSIRLCHTSGDTVFSHSIINALNSHFYLVESDISNKLVKSDVMTNSLISNCEHLYVVSSNDGNSVSFYGIKNSEVDSLSFQSWGNVKDVYFSYTSISDGNSHQSNYYVHSYDNIDFKYFGLKTMNFSSVNSYLQLDNSNLVDYDTISSIPSIPSIPVIRRVNGETNSYYYVKHYDENSIHIIELSNSQNNNLYVTNSVFYVDGNRVFNSIIENSLIVEYQNPNSYVYIVHSSNSEIVYYRLFNSNSHVIPNSKYLDDFTFGDDNSIFSPDDTDFIIYHTDNSAWFVEKVDGNSVYIKKTKGDPFSIEFHSALPNDYVLWNHSNLLVKNTIRPNEIIRTSNSYYKVDTKSDNSVVLQEMTDEKHGFVWYNCNYWDNSTGEYFHPYVNHAQWNSAQWNSSTELNDLGDIERFKNNNDKKLYTNCNTNYQFVNAQNYNHQKENNSIIISDSNIILAHNKTRQISLNSMVFKRVGEDNNLVTNYYIEFEFNSLIETMSEDYNLVELKQKQTITDANDVVSAGGGRIDFSYNSILKYTYANGRSVKLSKDIMYKMYIWYDSSTAPIDDTNLHIELYHESASEVWEEFELDFVNFSFDNINFIYEDSVMKHFQVRIGFNSSGVHERSIFNIKPTSRISDNYGTTDSNDGNRNGMNKLVTFPFIGPTHYGYPFKAKNIEFVGNDSSNINNLRLIYNSSITIQGSDLFRNVGNSNMQYFINVEFNQNSLSSVSVDTPLIIFKDEDDNTLNSIYYNSKKIIYENANISISELYNKLIVPIWVYDNSVYYTETKKDEDGEIYFFKADTLIANKNSIHTLEFMYNSNVMNIFQARVGFWTHPEIYYGRTFHNVDGDGVHNYDAPPFTASDYDAPQFESKPLYQINHDLDTYYSISIVQINNDDLNNTMLYNEISNSLIYIQSVGTNSVTLLVENSNVDKITKTFENVLEYDIYTQNSHMTKEYLDQNSNDPPFLSDIGGVKIYGLNRNSYIDNNSVQIVELDDVNSLLVFQDTIGGYSNCGNNIYEDVTYNSFYIVFAEDFNSVYAYKLNGVNSYKAVQRKLLNVELHNSWYDINSNPIVDVKSQDIIFHSADVNSWYTVYVDENSNVMLYEVENSNPNSVTVEWEWGLGGSYNSNGNVVNSDTKGFSDAQLNSFKVYSTGINSITFYNSNSENVNSWQWVLDWNSFRKNGGLVNSNVIVFEVINTSDGNSWLYNNSVTSNSLYYYNLVNSAIHTKIFNSVLDGGYTNENGHVTKLSGSEYKIMSSNGLYYVYYNTNSIRMLNNSTTFWVDIEQKQYFRNSGTVVNKDDVFVNNVLYNSTIVSDRSVSGTVMSYDYYELKHTNSNVYNLRIIEDPDNFVSKKLYLPLSFFFCNEPSQALPLIALQNHEVQFKIKLGKHVQNDGADLWVDYIFLDNDERKMVAYNPHEILFTQLQYRWSPNTNIDLHFRHPCKEFIWKTNSPYDSAVLMLNGQERMAPRSMKYYQCVQPMQYHTKVPEDKHNISVYSFALDPESASLPSGSCNMSRIDNAELRLVGEGVKDVKIWALNWNILKIVGGNGGVMYTN